MGETVEGGDGELSAVHSVGMVEAGIGGIAIAGSEDAAVAREGEGEHGTGIGYDAAFLILHLDGDDGEVATVGRNLTAVRLRSALSTVLAAGFVVSIVSVRMRLPFL